jgi:ABC-type branched-subunit amino acid transport system substrate-binding protein
MPSSIKVAFMSANRVIILALVTGLMAGCPRPRHSSTDGLDVGGSSSLCGDSDDLLTAGRFLEAAQQLERAVAASDSHRLEVCLGRALIGIGDFGSASRLLSPLIAEAGVDNDVWAAACIYLAWSESALGDLGAGDAAINRCELEEGLGADRVLLPGDVTPAGLLLIAARRNNGDGLMALETASTVLRASPDDTSRRWVLSAGLSAAAALDNDEIEVLDLRADDFSQGFAAWARLAQSVESEDWARFDALSPGVEQWLRELNAPEAELELAEWRAQRNVTRAAVFGGLFSLTGDARRQGRAALGGLLLASRSFDGDAAVESRLLIRDAGQTDESVTAAVAALDEAGVLAIIGPLQPELAEAAAREAEARGIPIITLSSHRGVTANRSWVFRLFADAESEGAALAARALDEGLTRVSVALPSPTPDYLSDVVESFSAHAGQAGVIINGAILYGTESIQGEAELAAEMLQGQTMDAILIADVGENATTLAAYLAVLDIWSWRPGLSRSSRRYVSFLGTSAWHNPEFLASGPDYLAGGVFTAWLPSESGRAATADFTSQFESVYARPPGLPGAFAYDGLGFVRTVVLDSGVRTRSGLREALERIEYAEGVTGEVHFGTAHASDRPPTLLVVTRDGFVPL